MVACGSNMAADDGALDLDTCLRAVHKTTLIRKYRQRLARGRRFSQELLESIGRCLDLRNSDCIPGCDELLTALTDGQMTSTASDGRGDSRKERSPALETPLAPQMAVQHGIELCETPVAETSIHRGRKRAATVVGRL